MLEWLDGSIAGIEVKTSATVRERDWRWLAKLRELRDDGFRAGIVIYTGRQTMPLGDRL